ncbi:hypothetical protein GQ607_009744 [Colletotrichum asianum]|uniref:Fungal N-terminal domain-containing protein n=1 Tax=Colletotrichum asianum TaxID=702518 RepID=A0A8H3W5U5_9PEZI|nr:hypothetical protein GQ607_009744 [Colletotrichum asianum]
MAEILGLASGVIAVVDMTTKVGGASIKLKRLWDEVNEVPSVLLQKAELVQGLDELFDQAERQLATQTLPALYNNKILLQKSTTKARSILAELQVMIDGLLEQSTVGRRYKRKIGSTKVVLRKSEIKSLDAKLDEALTHFQMAQSLYTMATLMHNPILAIETQSKNSNESDEHQNTSVSSRAYSDSGDENTDDKVVFTTSEPQGNFPVSASRTGVGRARLTLGSCGGFQFFLRTPDWLSSSVYAVIASKSITGWNLHLRAYEVVPNFFAIGLIDHFRNDDAMAIFKCLDEQNLTPFVRDMDDKEHWKLWWAFEYEIFAGDFWRMVEQPCIEDPELKVPGSWVEEPMDSVLVEWERSREWENEELPLLIWSEYRKIRPPM